MTTYLHDFECPGQHAGACGDWPVLPERKTPLPPCLDCGEFVCDRHAAIIRERRDAFARLDKGGH